MTYLAFWGHSYTLPCYIFSHCNILLQMASHDSTSLASSETKNDLGRALDKKKWTRNEWLWDQNSLLSSPFGLVNGDWEITYSNPNVNTQSMIQGGI